MQQIFTKPQFSKVNARQLLTNWAEGYSHATDEAVVVEVVANALDADASRILFEVDQARSVLAVEGNGRGMTAEDFHGYHDLPESTKVRGQGIWTRGARPSSPRRPARAASPGCGGRRPATHAARSRRRPGPG